MTDTGKDGGRKIRRRPTLPSEIQSRIVNPGTVRINSKGAYIVDGTSTPSEESIDADYEHDPRDIRLPNHTKTVSYIAIDVRTATGTCISIIYLIPVHLIDWWIVGEVGLLLACTARTGR